MSVCIICRKSSTDKRLTTVHKKGYGSLLKACKLRGDINREKLLLGSEPISIHTRCHSQYTNHHVLSKIVRKRKLLQDIPRPQTPPSPPSCSFEGFDFSTKCFICAETIPDDFQTHNEDQGMIVHSVKTFSELKNVVFPYLENRCDENAQEIVKRIGVKSDADTAGAKYHRRCIAQLADSSSKRLKRARPCEGIEDAVEYIYSYLADSQNCFIKISQLIEDIAGDYRPDLYAVKSRLQEKYGDKIRIFDYQGNDAFVSFRRTSCSVLPYTPFKKRRVSKEEERFNVVRKAAAIILEDIQSLSCKGRPYPPLEDFMKDVDAAVPMSLRIFLSEVVMKPKRGLFSKWARKCTAIAHAIVSAVRPKTFFSTLQMGVGGFFYKRLGSRQVIDLLSALGFCSSYEEVVSFEYLCNLNEQPSPSDRAFSQLELNNIDFDLNPCNRHENVHEIGEIHYVTPSVLVRPKQSTPRILKKQSKPASQSLTTDLSHEKQPTQYTLVENLDSVRPIAYNTQPTINDLVWLLAKRSRVPKVSGWNGFAEERKTNKNFITSKVLCVNSSLSSNDTIYNALLSAVEKSKAANQSSCVVTFDLHLYTRAYEIIDEADPTSVIKQVILRLGGFHLIMSFLDSIGYIMAGSGLEDLFRIIFRVENVKNIMSGHAFSKAIKGHVLIHLVLAEQIINSIELTYNERKEIYSIIRNTERSAVLTPADEIVVKNIAAKFDDESWKIEARGPTAKLWMQYFRMVTLVKQFIEAERSGDWDLHLDTMRRMLPYFHASGKLLYATAAHMYIQDMVNLQKKIPPREYKQFTENGHYMIRRTHRFWSSITSDVMIEQSLIRTMKMAGVADQGHRIFESVLGKWTMGLIFLQKVCEKVENFCGVSEVKKKQNVGMESSGIFNEDENVRKIDEWLAEHLPFPSGTELQSISTGIVGDSSINCHLSTEIGAGMISRLVGLSFHSPPPNPTERVLPLVTMTNGIRIDGVLTPIDPLLIFQRMCKAKRALTDLETHLLYELAPYPLTLFTERGMLEGNKSSMYDCFSPLPNDCLQWFSTVEVVDGGYLLRCVGWDINVPFSTICEKYTKYVRENFNPSATIIFDLHPDNVNNLGPANGGGSNEILSANTVINKESMCVISQEEFLANKGNKALFIDMLKTELENIGCYVKQTMAHASALIVHRAIQIAPKLDRVVIVSENVDILVLLTGLKRQSNNIYFRRPENGSIPEQIYTPESLKFGQVVSDNILFLHAFSGCNTTSAVYDMVKENFLSTLEENHYLRASVELFKMKKVDPQAIAAAGEQFFIALYGGGGSESSINALRFKLFHELAKKNKLSAMALPPTKSAAMQHSLRTYHQVQTWLAVIHSPERWGWKKTSSGLQPVRNTMLPVSETLLRALSCKCKNNCVVGCGCRNAGLKCSIICSNCSGHVCENQPDTIDILRDNDNDIDNEQTEEIHGWNAAEEYEVIEDRVTGIEENQPTSSQYILQK